MIDPLELFLQVMAGGDRVKANDSRIDTLGIAPIQNVQTPKVPLIAHGDDRLGELCEELLFFAKHNRYLRLAGLAANQVGIKGERVMLNACFIDRDLGWVVALNPEIISLPGISLNSKEGCLTWPGKFIEANRSTKAQVRYWTLGWEERVIDVEGFEAKVWQHEINHLNGVAEKIFAPEDKRAARPNNPCPCGSGKKFKKCCGR